MEYVHVTYDGPQRSVYTGRKDSPTLIGPTNRILRINRGAFTFHLGEPEDYHPSKQRVVVRDTGPATPKTISFVSTAAITELGAEAEADAGQA